VNDGQILSTEEIEQLFSAARTGVDLPSARQEPKQRRARRVREVDFSRPSKFSPEAQRRFERAHQGFCRSASTQVGAELRSVIEFEVIDIDQLSWSAAVARVPQPSLYGLVETEPLGTTIMLGIELPLVLRMVDRLLGGAGDVKATRTEMTEIELAIARRLFRAIVAPLSVVWEELLGLTLNLREVELKLANINLAPPSEPTLTMTIEATSEGSSETMSMTIPYRSIEAAVDKLSSSSYGEGAIDQGVRDKVRVAVSAAEIDLRVEAAAVTLLLDDVLAMKPGDIVRLGTDANAGVTVFAGSVPVHRARPGRSGAKRAVEISGQVKQGGR
jgi:flagellar motor switch protein FliM